MISIMSHEYQCVHCGEWNETEFDPSAGMDQTFVEDCGVCCHPLVIHLHVDPATEDITITVEEEA